MLVLMACTLMVAAPIMMVGGIVMAIREDVGLSWLVAVTVPVLAVLHRPDHHAGWCRASGSCRSASTRSTGCCASRSPASASCARSSASSTRPSASTTPTRDLTDVAIRAGRWQAAMFPTVMLVANVASVGVLWFGGHRVESGDMQVGALTAYLSYLMQIVMSVMMGTFMMMMIPRSAVCADRIMEVLDTDDVGAAAGRAGHRPARARHAAARRRRLQPTPAPTRRCCATSSFRAEPGQTVAIIGSTGAGKTTLVNLVPRLFDATGGRVRGRRRRRTRPRARAALVGDRPGAAEGLPLLRDRRGPTCARQARRHRGGDVGGARDRPGRRLRRGRCPRGSTRPIAQGGTNVSGGQRQRLAIARAVVRRPEIYLFDDSFSALDLATDARLRAALRPVTRDATVVIVAQRVSTIRDADLILVLEDGVVVGRGTPPRAARDLRRPTRRSSSPSSARRRRHEPSTQARRRAGHAQGDRARPGRPGPGPRPVGRRHGRPEGQRRSGPRPSGCVRRMAPERNKAIAVVAARGGQRRADVARPARSSAAPPT